MADVTADVTWREGLLTSTGGSIVWQLWPRCKGQQQPNLENCGFARAMMKQMPSKMALSASKIATLAYGKTSSTGGGGGPSAPDELVTVSSSHVHTAPSLLRYEKDVSSLVDVIEMELQSHGKSVLTEMRKNKRLRELTVSLTVKRLVRQRLEQNLEYQRSVQSRTRLQVLTDRLGRGLVLTKRHLADVHDLVHIWHEQLKSIEGNFGQNVGLYFRFMRWLLVVNLEVLLLVLDFNDPDEARRSAMGGGYYHRRWVLTVSRGRGWFLTTPMYYGNYYRGRIPMAGGSSYYMPSAYLNITTLCITFQLIMLASSTARSYRKNFIDGLYTALGRTASNLLVLGVLAAISALTWLVMSMDASEGQEGNTISLLASALMISSSMALFPLLFQLLGQLENFTHARALMFITLIRMVVMAIIILWHHRHLLGAQGQHGGCRQEPGCASGYVSAEARPPCWEDQVGSELYQLMLVDLIFTLVVEIGLEGVRKLSFQKGLMWAEEPHFDIPRSTMFLIYGQTLVWTGTYFSPVLSLMGSLKLIITFYARKWSLEHNCQPQARSVRASQTQTVFRVVAFIVCFLAACFTGYIIFNVHPSEKCGPFQGRSAPWVVVNDTLNKWRDEGHTFVYGLAVWSNRPGVVIVLDARVQVRPGGGLNQLSVVAYYLRSLALAREEMIVLLRGQLALEGQDKVVLLQLIDDAASRLDEMRKGQQEEPEEELRVLLEPGEVAGDRRESLPPEALLAEARRATGTGRKRMGVSPGRTSHSVRRPQLKLRTRQQGKAARSSLWSQFQDFVRESSDEASESDSNISG
ncbi:transmembrane channel-like protein 6 [Pollicipes pollicipes]|uniref:transmembrane channel-like protein 6 n=1 Tax=Pollicipes pollicipes TaxID=41117 RepID=UPI001884D311|nr:transmembrane channel-like protein 6 [Pollicipes pollicipes]